LFCRNGPKGASHKIYLPPFSLLAAALACSAFAPNALAMEEHHTVLVEAEGFDDPGGWVIDQQFMDQMGSPFLMAHGLGVPVEDARTTVALPAAGTYRVLVRTRDWTAPWDVADPPGKFQLLVDGVALKTVFGTEGPEWHWQDGGRTKKGPGLFCRNGPKGAPHKINLVPFSLPWR